MAVSSPRNIEVAWKPLDCTIMSTSWSKHSKIESLEELTLFCTMGSTEQADMVDTDMVDTTCVWEEYTEQGV